MYVICLKNQPATVQQLHEADKQYNKDHDIDDLYLAAPTHKAAVDLYLHHFGFTWKERGEGVDCIKVVSTPDTNRALSLLRSVCTPLDNNLEIQPGCATHRCIQNFLRPNTKNIRRIKKAKS